MEEFKKALKAKDAKAVKKQADAYVKDHPEMRAAYSSLGLATLVQMVSDLRAAGDERHTEVEIWIQHAHGPQRIVGGLG